MRRDPDPILRQKTKRVREIDRRIVKLTEDMIETMYAENGVGLAANQVGVPLRVAVIQISREDDPIILINPKMIRREGEREISEGCLSLPGYQGMTKRSLKVRVKATDISGKEFRIRAEENILAQALEHELGHLNGELYVDHLVTDTELWRPDDIETDEE